LFANRNKSINHLFDSDHFDRYTRATLGQRWLRE